MALFRTIGRELLGLFVDDWVFALLIIAWVGVFAVLGRRMAAPWEAILFFCGLAVLLLVFAVRAARSVRDRL